MDSRINLEKSYFSITEESFKTTEASLTEKLQLLAIEIIGSIFLNLNMRELFNFSETCTCSRLMIKPTLAKWIGEGKIILKDRGSNGLEEAINLLGLDPLKIISLNLYHFNNISNDNLSWIQKSFLNLTELSLRTEKINDEAGLRLQKMSSLTSLRFAKVPVKDFTFLRTCTKITSLVFATLDCAKKGEYKPVNFGSGILSTYSLPYALQLKNFDCFGYPSMSNLTNLEISNNDFINGRLEFFNNLPLLLSANFNNCPHIVDVSLIENCPQLTSLNLGLCYLVSALGSLKNCSLKKIDLEACKSLDGLKFLKGCTTLEALHCAYWELDVEHLKEFLFLKYLDVNYCHFVNFYALKNCLSLTTLYIKSFMYRNTYDCLESCTSLKNLSITVRDDYDYAKYKEKYHWIPNIDISISPRDGEYSDDEYSDNN